MSTILVVDDDPAIRKLFRARLSLLGHQCIVAENGHTAIGALIEHTIDCVITDLNMPVVDGLGFIRQVRESGSDIPIVVMTGASAEDKAKCKAASGAQLYLDKPVSDEALRSTLDLVLSDELSTASHRMPQPLSLMVE